MKQGPWVPSLAQWSNKHHHKPKFLLKATRVAPENTQDAEPLENPEQQAQIPQGTSGAKIHLSYFQVRQNPGLFLLLWGLLSELPV